MRAGPRRRAGTRRAQRPGRPAPTTTGSAVTPPTLGAASIAGRRRPAATSSALIGPRRRGPPDRGGRRRGRRRGRVTSGGTTSRQTSIANGQRGWNRQPGGGSRRSGGEPGIDVERPPVGRGCSGTPPSSFCVYGWRGVVKTSLDRALLGDPAGVHDQHPVARLGDDRQVVGDEDQRQAELVAEALEQLEDLGLDHDVEGGRRLVADDDRRVAGEGHRDHRPLAHAARQLVRDTPLPRFCGMPTSSSSSPARLRACSSRLARGALDRLGDLVADPLDRVERVHRALEDDADLAPAVAPQLVLGLGHEVDARTARCCCPSGSGRSPGGCRTSDSAVVVLPQPDSPAIPSASPLLEPEAHAVDRLDRARSSSVKCVRRSSTTSSGAPGPPAWAAAAAGRRSRSWSRRRGAAVAAVSPSGPCASASLLDPVVEVAQLVGDPISRRGSVIGGPATSG